MHKRYYKTKLHKELFHLKLMDYSKMSLISISVFGKLREGKAFLICEGRWIRKYSVEYIDNFEIKVYRHFDLMDIICLFVTMPLIITISVLFLIGSMKEEALPLFIIAFIPLVLNYISHWNRIDKVLTTDFECTRK